MIQKHLDKNNLHHAYLIEGSVDVVMPQILEFVKDMEVSEIKLDTFKIEDARNLKSYESFKALEKKKAFVIYANSFLLEAQNSLLKMFEEPIENTHFFLVVPDTSALLKTFISRFYVIKVTPTPEGIGAPAESVGEKFIKMSLQDRLEFVKELVAKPEDEDEEVVDLNSTRAKALKFLNALESVLHKQVSEVPSSIFHQIFKVREFLRMPGSSAKTLMESLALVVPVL